MIWKILIIVGFLASCIGAFLPLHQKLESSDSDKWITGDIFVKQRPVRGALIIAVGVIAAILAGITLFGSGSEKPFKVGIALLALVTLLFHVVMIFKPHATEEIKFSNVATFGWLAVALVVCGGIAAIAFNKL